MFKNLLVYRLGPTWSASLAQVDECLAVAPFAPCGATQPVAMGWVPPRGNAHGAMAEGVDGQWLAKLMIERKVVPGSVVKRRVEEKARQIEQETGRKPGKKHTKEIKDEVLLELLPMAFTKQSSTLVWIDPEARLLMLDAGSTAHADEVITALMQVLDGLVVMPLHTAQSPAGAMSAWLDSGEAPSPFTIDRDCELKASDDSKAAVRYARHPLDIEEVRQHIAQGKLPTRLALTWNDRVSFVLTDALQIKKLTFLEGVFEGQPAAGEDAFDTDVAITTGELVRLIPDLVDALGGEQQPGGVPTDAPGAAVTPPKLTGGEASPSVAPWEDAPSA